MLACDPCPLLLQGPIQDFRFCLLDLESLDGVAPPGQPAAVAATVSPPDLSSAPVAAGSGTPAVPVFPASGAAGLQDRASRHCRVAPF